MSELIRAVPGAALDPRPKGGGSPAAPDPEISLVTEDSRRVRRGALFVARAGTKGDGAAFVSDAIERGAVAIVTGRGVTARDGAGPAPTWITCEDPARAAAHLAHASLGWPSRSMKLAAVTGTNGKTTVATLVRQILEATGVRCGLIGTVEVNDGKVSRPASLTTPAAEDLAAAFASMKANGCGAATLEASSHALEQRRLAGIEFDVALFTNLTGDHLDYHGTMEAYAAAKARLFESLAPTATAIVNAMDPTHARMIEACRARVIRCALREGDSRAAPRRERADETVLGIVHASTLAGNDLTLAGPWGELRATVPLTGLHNAMNTLQAVAAAHALGAPARALEGVIAGLRAPPGRFEPVTGAGAPFQVLVDYAHTDDALANALGALRPLVRGRGRLLVVFGCGGDRDPTKRPRMAAVAARGADLLFVTSDNPRTEMPETIIDQVWAGIPAGDRSRAHRESDRRRAIEAAIAQARAGDVILIAGKGHEDYQIVGTEKRHFDDREVARGALENIHATAPGTLDAAAPGTVDAGAVERADSVATPGLR